MRPGLRWLVIVFGLAVAGVFLWRFAPPRRAQRIEPPPVLAPVPPFTLTDQDARPFGSAQLAGKPYVACFFFTSCPSICPRLMSAMSRLFKLMEAAKLDVRFLSVTIDPENDTPEKLRAYGENIGIDFRRWTLLTGPSEAVRGLVREGFLTALGDRQKNADGVMDIAHGGHLVLVDGRGRIRGFFSSDPEGQEEAVDAAKRLLAAESP